MEEIDQPYDDQVFGTFIEIYCEEFDMKYLNLIKDMETQKSDLAKGKDDNKKEQEAKRG